MIPPLALTSLKTVPNPVIPKDPATGAPIVRADLVDYVANLSATIQLGKALFWDMQAGSDNRVACATCHFQAGADVRTKNQLNGGFNASLDVAGPNFQLTAAQFPSGTPSGLSPTYDDVVGSQGVRASTFLGFSKSGAESTTTPTGFRQVTGKNTPPVVNAVFNHRQFWDGRAQPDFNGANPFGARDTSARVWVLDYRGFPVQVAISIRDASLASQAVGPPLNPVEMSAAGRTFPDLGKKMLALKPLGLQRVSASDSVLGAIADTTTGKGLTTTYPALIRAAFQPKWWNSNKSVTVNAKSYTMMQANFSLYWGLAIMLYQATLVSDDSPMDQFLSYRVIDPATGLLLSESGRTDLLGPLVNRLQSDSPGLVLQDILNGLALFEKAVREPGPSYPAATGTDGAGCIACHLGAELTSASVRNVVAGGLEPGHPVLKAAGFDTRMERMFMNLSWPLGPLTLVPYLSDQITFNSSTYEVYVTRMIENPALLPIPLPLPVKTYDAGWYNVGVRPTSEDTGLGGTDPWGKKLSWTEYFQQIYSDPSFIKVPGGGLPCLGAGNLTFPDELLNAQGFPLLSGPLRKTEPTDVAGSFKTAHLRNVELNGPYLHNGGKATLMQVVDFYDNAGNFPNPTKSPLIVPLRLTADQAKALVAFLISLTDERVRYEQAPFDHPQLFVPNGESAGTDTMVEIPAVGAAGGAALQRFLNLNPFQP